MSAGAENLQFIYEPVRLFQKQFRDRHAATVSACFEELVKRSGVSAEGNAATVSDLRQQEEQLRQVTARNNRKKFWRGMAIFFAVLCLLIIAAMALADAEALPLTVTARVVTAVLCAATAIFLFVKIIPGLSKQIAELNTVSASLQKQINELTALAWRQMEPLNKLYEWNLAPRLFSQTLPLVGMDAWFDAGRMDFLSRRFDWSPSADNQSTLAVQSGELQGNPFVFAAAVSQEWSEETYYGELNISWMETVTDADGKRRRVRRYETLRASVTAPKPFYLEQTRLFYGNDAAPDLSFSRHAGRAHELSERQRKNKIADGERKLEAMTRDAIKRGGEFLDMTNKEFDVLFNALDRDHQQQFRLLFTPLAQKEMARLLTDSAVGFGDDFEFTKARRLNIITPAHLQALDFTPNPARWQRYSLEEARKFFNDYHNDYFRRIYFSFAPLLVIPLYQQQRPPEHIYQEVWVHRLAPREHEAAANSLGDKRFAHPLSVTRNILKTRAIAADERRESLTVTAHGFVGEPRRTYVETFGGDGRWHDVPVDWIEYIPVARESSLHIEHPRADAALSPSAVHRYKDFKLTL
ncbi:MAG: hypothetical protein LBK60_05605 [Verrucomicrobiales bacterium]|jgi:hypothetical protein|nr:hypothetical protein [Verrucomicrobiales bacterium]